MKSYNLFSVTPALSTPLTPQGLLPTRDDVRKIKIKINGRQAAVEAGRGGKEDGGCGSGGEGEEEEDKSIIIQEA